MEGFVVIVGDYIRGMFLWHWYNLPGIHFYEAKVKEPAEDVKVSVVVPYITASVFEAVFGQYSQTDAERY